LSRFLPFLLLLFVGCGPARWRTVSLTPNGRTLPKLFLGGWDGRRLGLFDDTVIEPGVTTRQELERAIARLSSELYAVAWVDVPKPTDEQARRHDLMCPSPACLVVFDRNGTDEHSGWGKALALFELAENPGLPIGQVWIEGKAVRSPGPTKWPLLCRSKTDFPTNVHPDGGAWYPARLTDDGGFAVFGAYATPNEFRRKGFRAPSETTCDENVLMRKREEERDRARLKAAEEE